MKAWVAKQVVGGWVVDCIDGATGEVCLHLGGTEYKAHIVDKEEADRLVTLMNERARTAMMQRMTEFAEELKAIEAQKNQPSNYTPVHFED